jgi:ribosomal-protein-alanine N-acetyltransferase
LCDLAPPRAATDESFVSANGSTQKPHFATEFFELRRSFLRIDTVFSNLPALETQRLLLRKMSLDDANDLFEYASDPEVSRHTTWEAHQTIEDSHAFLGSVVELYKRHQVASWGVVHKQDAKFIGTCGFVEWLPHHARAEIAYALSRSYWGQGYMTEAVRRVVDFGFRVMALHRIEARCEVENIGSARVMEKTGMIFEGVLRGHMFAKGRHRDLELYSILRDEWAR